jgi:hypothetical protein
MLLRALGMITVAIFVILMAVVPIWGVLTPHTPVKNLRSMDGCYEGDGMPDFMRPARHWTLQIAHGTLINRAGAEIAKLRFRRGGHHGTPVSFSPGINVRGKPATVMAGNTFGGYAYFSGSRVTIVLADELRQKLLGTSCS